MGFLQITSRIGAASSPWIAKALKALDPRAPFIVMGSLSLLAVLVCMPLPETKDRPICDTMEDEESGLNNGRVLEVLPNTNEASKNLV